MSDLTCKWCNKSFSRERTLSSHMCEKKRRQMCAEESNSRIAFNVWDQFRNYVSPNSKKKRSIEDFIESRDYIAFMKFANYVIELRPVDTEKFVKWLFKMGVDIKDWTKHGTYHLYVTELSKKETPERATERAVLLMQDWCSEKGNNWQDFFKVVPASTAMNMILSGRISPWILYSLDAAQEMLNRMEPGQLDTIARSIDTEWWKAKIKRNPDQVKWINQTLSLTV